MPRALAASTASTASCGPAIGTDITAPTGDLDAAGLGEAGGVRVHPGHQLGVVAEHGRRRERRPRGRRGQPGVVDERAGGVDQVLAHLGGGEHRTALRRERLRQGGGDDDVLGLGLTGRGDEPAPARADHAQGVRLVDDEDRAGLGGQGDEVVDRGGVAEHRVDRLDDDHRAGALAPGEQLGDVLDVVVPRHRDRGPRQPAPVDQAGVGVLVADDERAGVGEGGEHRRGSRRTRWRAPARRGRRSAPRARPRARRARRGVPVTSREAPAPPP